MYECCHTTQIYDKTSGYICTSCGLILDTVVFHEELNILSNSPNVSKEYYLFHDIHDTCVSALNRDVPDFIEYCVDKYSQIGKQVGQSITYTCVCLFIIIYENVLDVKDIESEIKNHYDLCDKKYKLTMLKIRSMNDNVGVCDYLSMKASYYCRLCKLTLNESVIVKEHMKKLEKHNCMATPEIQTLGIIGYLYGNERISMVLKKKVKYKRIKIFQKEIRRHMEIR